MDRDKLRIPKSFEQLKDLNDLLKKYRDIYPFQIFVCFVVTYLLYVFISFETKYFSRWAHISRFDLYSL